MTTETDTSLDQQISAAIVKQKDAIVKGLIDGAVSSLQRDLGWKVARATEEHIDKFIKEEVLPEVQAQIEARRNEIVAAMVGSVDVAMKHAGVKLAETAAKNLAQSWNMKKLAEAMFG
jgi:hypothetical protein